MLELHEKYGDIVRIAPNQLAYASAQGWKEIYGHRTGHAQSQLPKNQLDFQPVAPGVAPGILRANDEEHSRLRRLVSHAFSAKALEDQEPLILEYVNRMTSTLAGEAPKGPQDMVAWYNWTTFDLIGDLAFGEPFHCLTEKAYHPWIKTIFDAIKIGLCVNHLRYYPQVYAIVMSLMPKSVLVKQRRHYAQSRDKIARRLEKGATERPDFMTFVLRNQGTDKGLSLPEMVSTGSTMVLAGSETTATLLSGVTYMLCTHPDKMEKILHEIRVS